MDAIDKIRLLWCALKGDENALSLVRWKLGRRDYLLHDHDLRQGDVVYDVGGYVGDWTARMNAVCPCEFWVFEPSPESTLILTDRFSGKDNVHLIEAGLGGSEMTCQLSLKKEGSTIMNRNDGESATVRIMDASEYMLGHGHQVALMKINIEGAEYDLVDNLCSSGQILNVDRLLIQFHSFVKDADERYREVTGRLSGTHRKIWSYPFLWEMWRRIPSSSAAPTITASR